MTGQAGGTGGNAAVGTTNGTSTATCPAGTIMLGGGANITQGNNGTKAVVASSYPSAASAWSATAMVTVAGTGTGSPASITSYVICGS